MRSVESPYLTIDECVAYLRFNSKQVIYWHIKENRLPHLRRGRRLLFDKRELDQWVRGSTAIQTWRERKRAS